MIPNNKKDLFNVLIPASKVEKTINDIKTLIKTDNVDQRVLNAVLKAEVFLAKKAFDSFEHNTQLLCDISNLLLEGLYTGAGSLRRDERIISTSLGEYKAVDPKSIQEQLEALIAKVVLELNNQTQSIQELLSIMAVAYHGILKIQPFIDRNEKIARLYANYIGLKYGLPFFEIAPNKSNEAEYGRFLTDLKSADAGDLEAITTRVKKACDTENRSSFTRTIGKPGFVGSY